MSSGLLAAPAHCIDARPPAIVVNNGWRHGGRSVAIDVTSRRDVVGIVDSGDGPGIPTKHARRRSSRVPARTPPTQRDCISIGGPCVSRVLAGLMGGSLKLQRFAATPDAPGIGAGVASRPGCSSVPRPRTDLEVIRSPTAQRPDVRSEVTGAFSNFTEDCGRTPDLLSGLSAHACRVERISQVAP